MLLMWVSSFSVFAQDPGWPRQLTNNGTVLILYTPQVEDWPQYETIDFRMAFQLDAISGKTGGWRIIYQCDNDCGYL